MRVLNRCGGVGVITGTFNIVEGYVVLDDDVQVNSYIAANGSFSLGARRIGRTNSIASELMGL